jgi:hypothetical protein
MNFAALVLLARGSGVHVQDGIAGLWRRAPA